MELLKFVNNEPGWDLRLTSKGAVIRAPSQNAADQLVETGFELLVSSATKVGALTVRWAEGKGKSYTITGSMAEPLENQPETEEIPDVVFGEGLGFDALSLKILERMHQSDKPMSICDLEDDSQQWGNRGLALMLRMPIEQVTRLNMRDYWAEDGLRYVKQMLSQQSTFEYSSYQAMLPYGAALFSSTFEVIEFGLHLNQAKRKKRLVTIHSYEPIIQAAWV